MAYTLTIDFSKPIALFPLDNCVLLPHTTIPLHIFEQRYRAMTRDAIDSSGLIAMAIFDGDRYKTEYEGQPPIRDHVCVGYIVHHDRLVDGRYNMLLQGVARARIEQELLPEAGGYRHAILRPIEERVMEIDLDRVRRGIEGELQDPQLRKLACVGNVCNWLSPDLPTPAVVDLTWQALARDTQTRYEVLSEPSSIVRADRLLHLLKRTRRTLAMAEAMGPSMSETGLSLN